MHSQYPVRRPRNLFHSGGPRSDQELIAELDSRLNKWMDSVPAHRAFFRLWIRHCLNFLLLVKWHQKHENELFRQQSACLYSYYYYYLQIFIHRPFVPSPQSSATGNFPSLAICTNAARSCCHVLEAFSDGLSSLITNEVFFRTWFFKIFWLDCRPGLDYSGDDSVAQYLEWQEIRGCSKSKERDRGR